MTNVILKNRASLDKIGKTKSFSMSSIKATQKKPLNKATIETKFWQQIALEQQAILHAKHNT